MITVGGCRKLSLQHFFPQLKADRYDLDRGNAAFLHNIVPFFFMSSQAWLKPSFPPM
jgi:hypothetical protein